MSGLPALLRRIDPRGWAWLLGGYAYLATVVGSTVVGPRSRAEAGLAPEPWSAAAWQAVNWGCWIPVGWLLWAHFRRRGLGARSLTGFALAGLVVAPALALLSAALSAAFSPYVGVEDVGAQAEGKLPVALLAYTALGAVGFAAAAQRRADTAARLAADLAAALERARAAPTSSGPAPERLMVAVGSRRVPLDPAEVEWFGSAGNYVVVNWNGREGLIRETMQALEKRLDPTVFARSHRSAIVNLARVRETASLSDGSWRLVMESGAELVASRTHRDEILRRLGR